MEDAINDLIAYGPKNKCQAKFLRLFQPRPTNLLEFGSELKPILKLSFITGLAAIVFSLECRHPVDYLKKITEIKATLSLKQNVSIGSGGGSDEFVLNIVNLHFVHEHPNDISVETHPFHNIWSDKISQSSGILSKRSDLEPAILSLPIEPKAARSSVTRVFQFQGMLEFATSYIEAGQTFRAMKVPLKASLLFRNYGHAVPICDAMKEYYRMWFSLPSNRIVGKRYQFTALARNCDGLKQILGMKRLRNSYLMDMYYQFTKRKSQEVLLHCHFY